MLTIATLHAVDYYTKAAEEAFSYYGKDSSALMEADPGGKNAKVVDFRRGKYNDLIQEELAALLAFFAD